MADPFSIVAGSLSVAEICFRVVHNIHRLQQSIGSIDEELKGLVRELESLHDVCTAVQAAFTAKSAADVAPELWAHLGRALANCGRVAVKLDDIVSKIQGGSSSSLTTTSEEPSKLHAVGKALRKKLREGDLENCRAQLLTYQNALQLVLIVITLYVDPSLLSVFTVVMLLSDP